MGTRISHAPRTAWGPPGLLYYRYRVTFPWVKWSGRGVEYPSSSEVKGRVYLYPYSPFGPSWSVLYLLLNWLWRSFGGRTKRNPGFRLAGFVALGQVSLPILPTSLFRSVTEVTESCSIYCLCLLWLFNGVLCSPDLWLMSPLSSLLCVSGSCYDKICRTMYKDKHVLRQP